MRTPTALQVAIAVAAAARETGEDPLLIVDRCAVYLRLRHYAAHAIAHCFPGVPSRAIGRMLGAPNPTYFVRSSLWYVRGMAPHRDRQFPRAEWWSEETQERVTAALCAVCGLPAPAPGPAQPARPARAAQAPPEGPAVPLQGPAPPPRVAPVPRPAPPAPPAPVPQAVPRRVHRARGGPPRPMLVAAPFVDPGAVAQEYRTEGQRAARDMLREAAENTRRLQQKEPDDE